MSTSDATPTAPLPEYFKTKFIEKPTPHWKISCRWPGCDVNFVVRSLALRPGATLTLLNHAHSHDRTVKS